MRPALRCRPPLRIFVRATATGELAPETLRRLIHSLVDAQDSRLRDDATSVMFEWRPEAR